MWLFTNIGFISIVESEKEKNVMIIRARNPKHLKELFPNKEIIVIPNRDYCCRVFISRDELVIFMGSVAKSIIYGNFKDSIIDDDYHNACFGVWSVMNNYQTGYSTKYGRNI